MAFLQNGIVNNTITWTQQDSSAGNLIIDQGEIEYQKIFSSGTGYGKVDVVFYSTGTVQPASSNTVDLFNLTRTIFGSVSSISLSGGKIKSLNIENLNTGNILEILFTGSNPFTMNIIGSGINLYPNSYYSTTYLSGYQIYPSNRYFYLRNQSATGIIYQICVLGNIA